MITRKEKIELYLKEYTESAIDTAGIDITGITASEIAETLLIDRTTSSRELNSLYNDGIAMKFLGRPTHYLHYPTVFYTDHSCSIYYSGRIKSSGSKHLRSDFSTGKR